MFGFIFKIFCPKVFFLSHLDDFNKNAHLSCVRGIIEVDEMLTIQDIFIDTLSGFTRKNFQERKQIS